MQDLTALQALTELGHHIHHVAKRDFYRQVRDRNLRSTSCSTTKSAAC
jgi:hypothetical protein